MVRPVQPDVPRGRLLPQEHTAFDGTLYFDEELQVPSLDPHRIMVFEMGTVFEMLAKEHGLRFISDHPIWYLDPNENVQRAYYGDLVIARDVDIQRITASDLLLAIEVVSTNDRRKEVKDRVFKLALNESNGVPEFGLLFPDADDQRALIWHVFEGERYREVAVAAGGEVAVQALPGLVIRVLPRAEWTEGHKLELVYQGEVRRPLAGERERAVQAEARADQAEARADQAEARADQERRRAEEAAAKADRLAARLRALGIDPE